MDPGLTFPRGRFQTEMNSAAGCFFMRPERQMTFTPRLKNAQNEGQIPRPPWYRGGRGN